MKTLWGVLGGVAAVSVLYPMWLFTPSGAPETAPAAMVSPKVKPVVHAPVAPPVTGELILTRAPSGHFYADGFVNGTAIRFIVDTGATRVALSRADAARAGLSFADAEFTSTAKGAGGPVAYRPVTLDRVTIGTLEARQVDAAVLKGDLAVSLLGQSWLKTVGSVSITGDTMVLR